MCFILSIVAIIKPNDYIQINSDPLLYSSATLMPKKPNKNKFSINDNSLDDKITTYIKECKIRSEDKSQVIYFRILVIVDGKTHNVLRTHANFEMLNKSLKLKFPGEDFPYMEIPSFPTFQNGPVNLDQRMKAYSNYLDGLCKPEFMIEVLMDFLEIYGADRIKFLQGYKYTILM